MINIIEKTNQREILYKETKDTIQELYLKDLIPWVVGYSGGKDSTLTTQIIINTLIDMKKKGISLNKKIYVISSDTLVETPLIINTIKQTLNGINKLAATHDLPISASVVSPLYNQTFWVNIIGRGYPTPNQTFRWCTDRMKIDPANRFIKDIVGEFGVAIMVLGVREGESSSRDRVLEKHSFEGKELMKHSTMINTYVYAPIKRFSIDDVWDYLLKNNSPWGGDNFELYKLYSDSSTECPLIVDEAIKKESGSCGNSRFGCWTCTVVSEDKSLTGFINTGTDWLRPLLEYRNWLASIRDDYSMRMKRRTNGSLYFAKIQQVSEEMLIIPAKGSRNKLILKREKSGTWIDHQQNVWNVFENTLTSEEDAKMFIASNNIILDSGEDPRIIIKNQDESYAQLGTGPFTMEARRIILEKLLKVERDLPEKYQLIRLEELHEIRKIWIEQGDLNESVARVYENVYHKQLEITDNDVQLFNSSDWKNLEILCEKHQVDFDAASRILKSGLQNLGFINRKEAISTIEKMLNKESSYLVNYSGETYDH